MTMLAVLALLASVLMWATPQAAAQNSIVFLEAKVGPTAASVLSDGDASGEVTVNPRSIVYLGGSATTIPEDATVSYKWVIETGPYSWPRITQNASEDFSAADATAQFTIPNETYINGLADSEPQKYEFKVTLSATFNGLTETQTVTVKIARPPSSDITVFAGLEDTNFSSDADSTLEEVFGKDAVIDGPGENGNDDNEWDIMEGAYLRLNGSGSTVAGGTVDRYRWVRSALVPSNDNIRLGGERPDTGAPLVSGDNDPNFVVGIVDFAYDSTVDTNTASSVANSVFTEDPEITLLPQLGPKERVTVVYDLFVADGSGRPQSSRVRIVVHDVPEDAKPIAVTPTYTTASKTRLRLADDAEPQGPTVSRLNGGVENQYIVSANSIVRLTVNLTTSGISNAAELRWDGATREAPDSDNDAINGNTATRRIPAGVAAGTTYNVTVSHGSGQAERTATVQLLVGTNQAPTAGGISASIGDSNLDSASSIPDIPVFSVRDGKQKGGALITLRGVGNDPDGGAIIQAWTLRQFAGDDANNLNSAVEDLVGDTPDLTKARDIAGFYNRLGELDDPSDPLVTLINPIGDGEVSFEVPEVRENTGFILLYSVVDSAHVVAAQPVYIHVTAEDDKPVANAGANQQVASGSRVRLNGSASADPDPDDSIASHSWIYVGATMSPLPDARRALSDAEIKELNGWVLREATDNDPAAGRFQDSADKDYVWIVNAAGDLLDDKDNTPAHLKGVASRYPYFTAPKLTSFNNISLKFRLTVTDSADSSASEINGVALKDGESDDGVAEFATADVTITVARVASNEFYSGVITGPGFCTNRSFGGPMLFAHDGDGDGVAETCSLNTTRRATIARQNALEAIAALNPTALDNAIDDECKRLVAANASYGDEPVDLANDACDDASNPVAVIPVLSGATQYGPVVTGPAFCTNRSLGGSIMYPHDSDGDGVYDICSLNSTRREAVARQAALATFEDALTPREMGRLADLKAHDDTPVIINDGDGNALTGDDLTAAVAKEISELEAIAAANAARYANALAAACRALAGQVFEGDKAADLATDECVRPTTSGIALPSGS